MIMNIFRFFAVIFSTVLISVLAIGVLLPWMAKIGFDKIRGKRNE